MNDLIQRITQAIFRQEGMPENYPNPGNLRAAPWLNHAAINPQGFWQPATRAEGVAGAAHCVALRIAMGQTLRQLISAWAPRSENDTEKYIADVKLWAHIPDENVTLYQYITEIPS